MKYFARTNSVRRKGKKNQTGFSLIELMISMVVGLTLVAGVIEIVSGTVKSSSDFLSLTRIDQDLNSIMTLMVKEVRRAGFDSNYAPGEDTDFYLTRASSSCLLYSYDDLSNADDGGLDDEERFAFKQNNNTIQYGEQATSCSNAASWSNVNDSNVTVIEDLKFTMDIKCLNLSDGSDCSPGETTPGTGDQYVEKYQLTIEITGKTKGASNSQTVKTTVRSHNDVIKTK